MAISKAVILAAGYGTRLGRLTDERPKALLKVGGRCLIDYAIDWLSNAGINELYINLHWHGDQIITHLRGSSYKHLNVRFFEERPTILGTGGGIRAMLSDLGDQPFVVVNSDTIILEPLEHLIASHIAQGAPDAMLEVSDNSDMVAEYGGRIWIDRGRVIGARDDRVHSSEGGSRAAYCGVTILTSKVWGTSNPNTIPACLIKDVLTPWLLTGAWVGAYNSDQIFLDIGTPERLRIAEDILCPPLRKSRVVSMRRT